jgi:hypothetical protein
MDRRYGQSDLAVSVVRFRLWAPLALLAQFFLVLRRFADQQEPS